ncbi:D site-binding protein-like isoform X2 [Apteryx mantelli]|uniref:D site-binding protein-like isoform X2 n=1 Tax=Apteryx mantelli TaxID=2696672 RepID=A0ABM4FZT3_9AVES
MEEAGGCPGRAPGPFGAPLLWERPGPLGDLEYVDLDEFLREHGLPASPPERDRDRDRDRERPAAAAPPRAAPSPGEPQEVEVLLNFEPDPADLALSSVPGHEAFDPRKHRFSQEELKPQPIMKKARKIQDEKYWSRRYKNNEAAKRSRDARRLKENQISVRAAFLERENAVLRQEVLAVRQELGRYRSLLARYEARHGAL